MYSSLDDGEVLSGIAIVLLICMMLSFMDIFGDTSMAVTTLVDQSNTSYTLNFDQDTAIRNRPGQHNDEIVKWKKFELDHVYLTAYFENNDVIKFNLERNKGKIASVVVQDENLCDSNGAKQRTLIVQSEKDPSKFYLHGTHLITGLQFINPLCPINVHRYKT
eukprot:UN30852